MPQRLPILQLSFVFERSASQFPIFLLAIVLVASCFGCSDDSPSGGDAGSPMDGGVGDGSYDGSGDSGDSGGDAGGEDAGGEELGPYRFVAEAGFELDGLVEDGAEVVLESSTDAFGTKTTQHPSLYDLVDRGSWIQGERLYPYGDPELGEEVPTGDDYVFETRGGTPRFQGDGEPVGPDRRLWYGGRFVDDGAGNVTLRRPVRQLTAADDDPPKPRVDYYLSWFWRSTFLPGSDEDTGSSAKFIRVWDTEGGREDGYRVSWTRMHLTAAQPGSDPYPSWNQVNPPANEWAQFEFDSHTVDGGHIRAWVNGELLHDPTIPEVDPDWNGSISLNQWGYDPSVDISDPDHAFEISDLYADVSAARVVLADAPTMEEATLRVPQMHLSWSPAEIHLPDLYPGPLMTLEGAFMIVVTEDRESFRVGTLEARE